MIKEIEYHPERNVEREKLIKGQRSHYSYASCGLFVQEFDKDLAGWIDVVELKGPVTEALAHFEEKYSDGNYQLVYRTYMYVQERIDRLERPVGWEWDG